MSADRRGQSASALLDQGDCSRVVRQIAVLAHDRASLLDIAGPIQVFATASDQIRENIEALKPFVLSVLSESGGAITTSAGVVLNTDSIFHRGIAEFDTLFIAGGPPKGSAESQRLSAWLQTCRARRFASIGAGVSVLAEAGFLAGRKVAVHWASGESPGDVSGLAVESDRIFIEDHDIWTCAGGAAAIDLALAMLQQDCGKRVALQVAHHLLVHQCRGGDQPQISPSLVAQSAEQNGLGELLVWIVENPTADLRPSVLAGRVGMSERTLFRRFSESAGQTPTRFVETVRLHRAKRLLGQTNWTLKRIARDSGFPSVDQMRRTFLRRSWGSPARYRTGKDIQTKTGRSEE